MDPTWDNPANGRRAAGGMKEKCMVDSAKMDIRSPATKLQDRAINGVIDSFDQGKDAFLYGPTGVGKSRMFSVVAADRADKGERVLVLSHRQSLVTQGEENMEKWVDRPVTTSIGMNGDIDQTGDVVYSTVQTAHQKKDDLQKYDVVIVDEAHHVTDQNEEYRETLKKLMADNPNIKIMGASATPPEGYEGLHPRLKAADKHVITFEEAIETNLVRLPETRTPSMLYTDHNTIEKVVASKRKSSKSADLETGVGKAVTKMRGDDWAEQLVNKYEEHLVKKKTLAFFDSIKDANAFIAEALERNHPVAALHSGQSKAENDNLKAAFKDGRIKLLASVDMISEGYDIDCTGILLDKKTTSPTEYKQILGRGSRGHGDEDGPIAVMVDTGASTHMHGNIAAQAIVQTMRGEIERKTRSNESLLPDSPDTAFKPWVEMKVPGTDQKIWGTSVDGGVVYAVPTETGYAAFNSVVERKVAQVRLIQIENESKGRPSREAFADWVADKVLTNATGIASLIGTRKGDKTQLEHIVAEDWKKNAGSIQKNLEEFRKYPAVSVQRQAAMQQRQASL